MNLIGNINAIPFRRFRGGGGVAPFPSIPGMIARYSASGLTNEQMTENPVWKDLTGNGHDLQMKNFAWKGMSGVGGYKFNFLSNERFIDNYQVSKKYSYKIVINNTRNSVQLYNRINLGHIKITGIEINKSTFMVYDNVGMEHAQYYTKDGIYEIDYTANKGANIIYFYVVGGNIGRLENPITIEQLPLYPGALVFDGVDDYGVCENFPILTKEKGYTVVALRRWLSFQDIGYSSLVVNSTDRLAAFNFEDFRNETKSTWNWGRSAGLSDYKIPLLYTYQTSTSYNGRTILAGATEEGSNILQVCRSGAYCANAAIWEIVILDHDATEEELTKIKDYFVKTYPWLFPDQAWTVTGKTNEDEDRATIANITGNGNNLVLSNFGFVEGSGYNEEGEYAGYLVTDGVDDKVQSSSFTMNEDWTIVGDWELLSNVQINCGIVKAQNVYLYNTANGLFISINNPRSLQSFGTKSLHAICSDGRLYDRNWVEYEYTVDQNFAIVESSLNIGFNLNNYTQIAFKNLGIYNNQILSKEDCIKAYNYLQTLKAK